MSPITVGSRVAKVFDDNPAELTIVEYGTVTWVSDRGQFCEYRKVTGEIAWENLRYIRSATEVAQS